MCRAPGSYPLSAAPTSYTAAVERYLTGAGIAKSSARIYRISLTTWGWMLTGEPAPTGPARRGAKPPVFPIAAIDDPALPEVLAELAAARADEMDADTVNRELSIAGKAMGWWQRQGWIEVDPTIGIERRPAPPDRTKALAENQIAALWRLDVALREKTQWKMLHESAGRADEVLCLNVEDLYPQDKRGRSRPRAGRPSGFTGSPAPPSCCPGSSPAYPRPARCPFGAYLGHTPYAVAAGGGSSAASQPANTPGPIPGLDPTAGISPVGSTINPAQAPQPAPAAWSRIPGNMPGTGCPSGTGSSVIGSSGAWSNIPGNMPNVGTSSPGNSDIGGGYGTVNPGASGGGFGSGNTGSSGISGGGSGIGVSPGGSNPSTSGSFGSPGDSTGSTGSGMGGCGACS